MKRVFAAILLLCLLLAETTALAGRPSFTEQPETATTTSQGEISFSVKTKGTVKSYTWYFVNPSTGKKISGKKLPRNKTVAGVKVTGPNRAKITLKKVPETMHGWLVYCHITGDGYKVDSEYATLYVYGLEKPEEETAPDELGFKKQPKDTAISNEGKVVFSVTVNGLPEKITWGFINPKNGEKVIGKNILKRFKNIKVSGVNGKKLTITNAPETMAGWQVYAHLKGKGNVTLDSERATILAPTGEE